jgi:ribokinase
VIDTTGAGDAFVGGFASGWVLYRQDLDRAIQYGIVVSGLSVTKTGTSPAMPHMDAIQQMIREQAIQFLKNDDT